MRRIAFVLLPTLPLYLGAAALRAQPVGADRPTTKPTTRPADARPAPPNATETGADVPGPSAVRPDVPGAPLEFTELVDRLAPSVVAIESDRRPPALPDGPAVAGSPWVSFGAGVVIRGDGRILTCQHLIDGASSLHIILHDGRRMPARKLAEDRRSDLAVIRADGLDVPAASLAPAGSVARGQWVLAFGDPLGLARDGHLAIAPGVVAAVNRPLPPMFGREEDRYYGDLIQTTAPAGPGSSGGPLFSMSGQVVGVVAAMPTRTGDISPYAFAIPVSNRTMRIIDMLVEGRAVEHGYLGVEVDLLAEVDRRRANLPAGVGVRIESVFADGPADRAGLARGDIVTRINGAAVTSVDDFVGRIGAHSAGEAIRVGTLRGVASREVTVVLTRRPPNPEQALPEISMNFRGAALGRVNETMRAMSNLPDFAMLVVRVDGGSPAARAGLSPGDVIVRANGRSMDDQATAQLLGVSGDVMLGLANGGSLVVKR